MSFKVTVSGVDGLDAGRLAAQARIERRLYAHSTAQLTIDWDETLGYSAQQAASLAAKAINAAVTVEWNGNDTQENVLCFTGYVQEATGQRIAGKSSLLLDCISNSKRTDEVPRYRAFQAVTLKAICDHLIATENSLEIQKAADLAFDIPLSVQYGETDFAYLRRMLHAWGIPMAVIEKTGKVMLGARGEASDGKFPGVDYDWNRITFTGATDFYEVCKGGGAGPSAAAYAKVKEFQGKLKPKANDYYPIPDSQPMRAQFSKAHSQADPVNVRLFLQGRVLSYTPGHLVQFEDAAQIIRRVTLTGDGSHQGVTQEFELQPYPLPYLPAHDLPQWPSRSLWARVIDNEKDPNQAGRVQVEFEFEKLDPMAPKKYAWLHTMTPYGGGKSPSAGKVASYSGFYSLPEVGERVLVDFLGDWDSEAVISGTVRDVSVSPMHDAKETKRWRTPSGTEVAMTTSGGTDVIRIRCQDKIFFEAKMDGSAKEVYLTPGESDADIIHFKGGPGAALNILSSGTITLVAKQGLHLEGATVQVKASANLNIDGSMVLINTSPTPAPPLVKQKFTEKDGTKSNETRTLPADATPDGAGGGATIGAASGAGASSSNNGASSTGGTGVGNTAYPNNPKSNVDPALIHSNPSQYVDQRADEIRAATDSRIGYDSPDTYNVAVVQQKGKIGTRRVIVTSNRENQKLDKDIPMGEDETYINPDPPRPLMKDPLTKKKIVVPRPEGSTTHHAEQRTQRAIEDDEEVATQAPTRGCCAGCQKALGEGLATVPQHRQSPDALNKHRAKQRKLQQTNMPSTSSANRLQAESENFADSDSQT